MNKEKLKYFVKYTTASYADCFLCAPIESARALARTSEKILGNKTPKILRLEDIEQNSPVYKLREGLREKMDTRPGSVFLQSNIIGALPFCIAGIPAAQGAEHLIKEYMSEAPQIAQYVTNSLATLAVQMAAGYTTFMANEIRTNKDKYTLENGKLSPKKIKDGFANAIKAFLTFDLSYIALKTVGQSTLMALKKDPAVASVLFDTATIPAWYSIAIPLGLEKGVIQTKDYPNLDKKETKNNGRK